MSENGRQKGTLSARNSARAAGSGQPSREAMRRPVAPAPRGAPERAAWTTRVDLGVELKRPLGVDRGAQGRASAANASRPRAPSRSACRSSRRSRRRARARSSHARRCQEAKFQRVGAPGRDLDAAQPMRHRGGLVAPHDGDHPRRVGENADSPIRFVISTPVARSHATAIATFECRLRRRVPRFMGRLQRGRSRPLR